MEGEEASSLLYNRCDILVGTCQVWRLPCACLRLLVQGWGQKIVLYIIAMQCPWRAGKVYTMSLRAATLPAARGSSRCVTKGMLWAMNQ